MNDYIDSLKIKLIAAVDLNQKKINKVTDIKEALKELESFPMTLDILNTSRIGKIVNDIRHFKDAQSDIKKSLKDLIKQWNDQLLPHHNKKANRVPKSSNSNGCDKLIPESNCNSHYNNENHISKHVKIHNNYKSSNNLGNMNGLEIKSRDCDNSEMPNKKIRLNKNISSESPKSLLKEIHMVSDSCPPLYKSSSINRMSQKPHGSPSTLHFPDVNKLFNQSGNHEFSNSSNDKNKYRKTKTENSSDGSHFPDVKLFKRNEDLETSRSSSTSTNKHRKRKHDSSVNGITPIPLQKVKSTRELLAGMGDLVGYDTKKKILCNEIAFEDDIPKSCIPESVRPKPKLSKSVKSNQWMNENVSKSSKFSPKTLQPNVIVNDNDLVNDFVEFPSTTRSTNSNHSVSSERNHSCSNLSDNYKHIANQNIIKSSPYNHTNKSSPKSLDIKKPLISDNHAQLVATPTLSDDLEKCSLKIKIPLKSCIKKSKHHDPPITNRMNDLPVLPNISDFQPNLDIYGCDIANQEPIQLTEDIVQLLSHRNWEGHNCSVHPITGDLIGLSDFYIVNDLYVLAWTDKVNECNSFFPVDTEAELTYLQSAIGDCS